MSASSAATGRSTADWKRAIVVGIVGGGIAAAVMAMFAMAAAATYQGTGLFTPMYHIGSSMGGSAAMEAMKGSMTQAQAGDLATWFTGPALTGMALHMATGMMWGAVFGLLVVAARIPRSVVVPAGVAFGIAVMVVMSFVILPVTASLFGSGDPIRNMASMVGWGTFTAEHALFGLVLGVTALRLATRTSDITAGAPARSGQPATPARQRTT